MNFTLINHKDWTSFGLPFSFPWLPHNRPPLQMGFQNLATHFEPPTGSAIKNPATHFFFPPLGSVLVKKVVREKLARVWLDFSNFFLKNPPPLTPIYRGFELFKIAKKSLNLDLITFPKLHFGPWSKNIC